MIMEEVVDIDLELVKKRSLVGVVSLISRSFVLQLIAFAATIFLTIFLDAKVFGIFYLVSALVNFFSYFSDVGLAAALIQKKENLTREDLRTTFTLQQTLVISLLVILFLVSPFVRGWYNLNDSAVWLLYALGLSFFLSSLKTIPSILLERSLKFNLLVIPQILETLVFNLLAVFLAWKGFGLMSFTWAVLARGIIGLITMYLISPWSIGFSYSKDSLKSLLRFGLPYQANTLMAVVKDDLMTIFLGRVVGPAGLGYLGWAKKWSELPLRFLMDNVSKVTFPAYSRLQEKEESLQRAIEKTLFFLSFLTFPILISFAVIASDLVLVIPRYLKWQPALLALYLYCFNSAWATISTSMTNLLNAVGQIKKTFKLMVMWLFLTWIILPFLALKMGYNGVALGSALISLSSAVAIYFGRKVTPFDLISTVIKPLISAILMGLIVYFVRPTISPLSIQIILRVLIGGLFYLGFSYLFFGELLLGNIRRVYGEIQKRH